MTTVNHNLFFFFKPKQLKKTHPLLVGLIKGEYSHFYPPSRTKLLRAWLQPKFKPITPYHVHIIIIIALAWAPGSFHILSPGMCHVQHLPEMICTACGSKLLCHPFKVFSSKSVSTKARKELVCHERQRMTVIRVDVFYLWWWRQHWINVKHCYGQAGELDTYFYHVRAWIIQGCYSSKTRISRWLTVSRNSVLRSIYKMTKDKIYSICDSKNEQHGCFHSQPIYL